MEHEQHQSPAGDTGSRLERSVTLDTGIDLAWELVTQPDDLASWLGREVDLEPTPGSEGTVLEHDGTLRRLVIDEVTPGERIAWRWWYDGDDVEPDPSRVEITLTPAVGGTRIDVVEHRLAEGTTIARASALATTSLNAERWSWRLLHLELVSLLLVAARV